MDGVEDGPDVFAIPDFWKPSTYLESTTLHPQHDPFFALNVDREPLRTLDEVEVNKTSDQGYFKLPPLLDLPAIPDALTEPIPPLEGAVKDHDALESRAEDIWLCHDQDSFHLAQHKTWATFDKEGSDKPAEFITESEPGAFDALLAAEGNSPKLPSHDHSGIVDSAVYCACLLGLALGRRSMLYAWDEEQARFVATVPNLKISGLSWESLDGISKICLECGDTTRYLLSYAEKAYTSRAGPSRISLASAVKKLLLTIQSELGVRARGLRSPLQLQALVQPVRSILVYFRGLVERASPIRSDEQILSLLFEEAQSTEYRDGFLHNAMCEVLRMVSKPWLNFVEEWIGLRPEEGVAMSKSGPGKSFVKVENKMWIDDQGFELEEPDYLLDDDNMPSFVPQDMAQEIFETGRNLRFLRSNHPNHPLSRQDRVAVANPPSLRWEFDWDAITRVQHKARSYEHALLQVVRQRPDEKAEARNHQAPVNTGNGHEFQFFGQDELQMTAELLASIEMLDRPMVQKLVTDEGLPRILQEQLFDQQARLDHEPGFAPHWILLPFLSFGPTVAAQARLVNRECMRLLFVAHNLRDHLLLQRQYHLLGNGLFCSRLSHALFDPELDTAERQSGVALTGGVMGLRLGGRENWPPASSEFRLALMGVFADSKEPLEGNPQSNAPKASQDDLLEAISFAVRDLSPEEIDKCVDPDSLEALDFLRLAYKPPSALLPIMTPAILLKYDNIFRLLLRILRMLCVVNQLFRDVSGCVSADDVVLRFRLEAHHFVSQITAYFFETGIGIPWRRFEGWLDRVQEQLVGNSPPAPGAGHACSPSRLRDRHEQVLDEIMLALLLRKRQQPVLKLLEDIFAVMLRFAKLLREPAAGTAGHEEEGEVKALYGSFRKKVQVFITVCRGMSEKGGELLGTKGGGPGLAKDEENTITRLLLLLDMSGYFTR